MQTDEEEEFKTLEVIAKKRIRTYFLQLPLLIIISWFLLGGISNNLYFMKDGLAQIVAPLMFLGILLNLWGIVHFKSFLKRNRKNMEMGKSLEYSDSKFYIPKLAFPITFVFLIIILIYVLYMSMVLGNRIILIAFVPALIGLTIGILFRFYVKPSKNTLKAKKIGLFVTLIAVVIISVWISIFTIGSGLDIEKSFDLEEYKVLTIADFPGETLTYEGSLVKQRSFLVPESYRYSFVSKEAKGVKTEYARALTENLAKELVDRYIKQSEIALTGRYSREVSLYFEEDIFDDYLLSAGITEEDLAKLKNMDIKEAEKEARKIIQERSIIKTNEKLWNVDAAHFLSYKKREIVLRNGKEVYFLEGLDFSDSRIIEIVKKGLGLN